MSVSELFKVGDTVMLKSGGPVMTVQRVTAAKVHVAWYNETIGDFMTWDTVPATLTRILVVIEDEDEGSKEEVG